MNFRKRYKNTMCVIDKDGTHINPNIIIKSGIWEWIDKSKVDMNKSIGIVVLKPLGGDK